MRTTFLFLIGLLGMVAMAQSPTEDARVRDQGVFSYCGPQRVRRPVRNRQICVQDRWNQSWQRCRPRPLQGGPGGPRGPQSLLGHTTPAQAQFPVNCGNGFTLVFEDIESSTGDGFADPALSPCGTGLTLGQERVNTACAVFGYIASVIDLGAVNPSIYFARSEFDGTGPLASGSPFMATGLPALSFQAGYLRDHIVGGSDPNVAAHDAVITVDFGTRIINGLNFDVFPCQTCPNGAIDLYSVLLHEATHALGFFSFVNPNGTSTYSNSANGPFSLYDQFMRNNANANLIAAGGAFSGPVADLTGGLLSYFTTGNTQNEPVYAPPSWISGSSLSHFDDLRSNFQYLMRPATNGGDDRTYTMAELEVLKNLGYTLLATVYPNSTSANRYVIAADDPGYTTTPGAQVCIPALANDTDPDGDPISYGSCGASCTSTPAQVTVLIGNGTVSFQGPNLCFTPDPSYAGPVLIKYCPTDGHYDPNLVNTDNCAFIQIDVTGPCPGDPCNFVCNGGFENAADPCAVSYGQNTMVPCPSPFVADWCRYTNTPDIISRFCPSNSAPPAWYGIPNNFHAGNTGSGTEVWDFPNPSNNHYVGMIQASTNNYYEGIYVELSEPLLPGNVYELSLQLSAKRSYPSTGIVAAPVVVGFTSANPVGTPQNNLDHYAATNSAAFGTLPAPNRPQSASGVWQQHTQFIIPTTSVLRYLVIEPEVLPVPSTPLNGLENRVLVDDVLVRRYSPAITIDKTVSNSSPNRLDPVTYTLTITNNDPVITASGVTINDLLPAGLTFTGSNIVSGTGTFTYPNLNIPILMPGASVVLEIFATVDANAPLGVPITNCAYVTSGNGCANTGTNNCVAINVPATDLLVTKELVSGPGPYSPGATATFNIKVTNLGPMDATNVQVDEVLPAGLTYASHSFQAGPGTYVHPNLTIASLPVGATTLLSLDVTVDPNQGCGLLTNCVNLVSLDQQDLVLSNNSACANVAIGPSAATQPTFPLHGTGPLREQVNALAWHSDNNTLYVGGYLTNTIDFGGGVMTTNGSTDGFLVKYSDCGLEWQHHVGSAVADGIREIAVSPAGDLYVTGGMDAPFTYQGIPIAGAGSFVVALDPQTGLGGWGRSIPDALVNDIAVDPLTGNIAVVGSFATPFNFAGSPVAPLGPRGMFVAVYNSLGTELWARSYGSAAFDDGVALAYGQGGDLYVAGYLAGAGAALFNGSPVPFLGGNRDIFVGIYSGAGMEVSAFGLGTTGDDLAQDIAIDPVTGEVFLGGQFGGAGFTVGPNTVNAAGAGDGFVAGFGPGMTGNWIRAFGSAGPVDAVTGLEYRNGRVFASGIFQNVASFPGFPNAVLAAGGNVDACVLSLTAAGVPLNNLASSSAAGTMTLAYDVAANPAGEAWIGGIFSANVTFGASNLLAWNGSDAYVARAGGLAGGGFFKEAVASGVEAAGADGFRVAVYPNPSAGEVTIRLEAEEMEMLRIELIDLHGQRSVLAEAVEPARKELRIRLQDYPDGIYMLRLIAGEKVHTEKLVLLR